MATYSTYAELVQRHGAAALAAMIPADATDPVATLAAQAQVEAAAEIDMALGGCGYTVPVDTSAITDADQQARAAAFLRRLEIGLTVAALSRGEVGKVLKSRSDKEAGSATYAHAASDVSWARDQLAMLCARKSSIPGVTAPGRTFVRSGALAVPDSDDVANRISQAGAW